MRYCRRLTFTEQPNYGLWKKNFRELARERGFTDIENYVDPLLALSGAQPKWQAVSFYLSSFNALMVA